MNIPYTKHDILPEDIEAVTLALQSGMLTNGSEIAGFEADFGATTKAPYAIGTSSGTGALHMAVHALGVRPEQTVIVPSLTFAATANAVLYSGGSVEFVDVDPDTLLIDAGAVADKIQTNPDKYAGVIAVDFAGYPVDSRELAVICHREGKWLIEDAAHALGAVANYTSELVHVGSGEYADATIFSFHPAKHITTGEGGMITTRQAETDRALRLIRSHAMDHGGDITTDEPWRYQIDQLGFNYRMSEINAALGRSQLSRIGANIALRQSIAQTYRDAFDVITATTTDYECDELVSPNHIDYFESETTERGPEEGAPIKRAILELIDADTAGTLRPPLSPDLRAMLGQMKSAMEEEDAYHVGVLRGSKAMKSEAALSFIDDLTEVNFGVRGMYREAGLLALTLAVDHGYTSKP